MRSNLTIRSNIYPVETGNVVDDKAFRLQVRDRKALAKMIDMIYRDRASHYTIYFERLSNLNLRGWQKELFKEDLHCTIHPRNGAKPFGIVKRGDDYCWECRCDQIECERYIECRGDI